MFNRNKYFILFSLKENQTSFYGIWLFFGVYIGANIFAALLTYPTFCFFQWLNTLPKDNWFIEFLNTILSSKGDVPTYLLGKSPDTYYDRLRWIAILIGLPFIIKKCKLFSLNNLGVKFNKEGLRALSAGLLIGLMLVAFICSIQMICLDWTLKENVKISSLISSILLGAFILGFLEETIFRGILLRIFYTATKLPFLAVILSSLFFAYKHFKVPDSAWDKVPDGVSFSTGFFIFFWDTFGIFEGFNFVMFLNLLVFGIMLAVIFLRYKQLMAPIGLHAGALIGIFSLKKLIILDKTSTNIFFGSFSITDGYLGTIVLSTITLLLIFYKKSNKKENL